MNTVIRWNPFRELAAMQSAMDRIFEDTWREAHPVFEGNSLPIDAHETDGAYRIVANVPGVNPDDITINLHDNTLTIGVEIQREQPQEGTRSLVQERFYGKLTRSIRLPQPVETEAVEASYDNGVLTLSLPKSAEAQPRRIAVKHNGLLNSGSNN
ncbi:Hsp20/alpha crystallin family protein [bacterium]|nr:Hsp20/alpha crystallin family protein [bacterium]